MMGALSLAAVGDSSMASITDNFQHAILMAPCTLIGTAETSIVGLYTSQGIDSIPSNNWEVDVATYCQALGEDTVGCAFMQSIDADYSGRLGTKLLDHIYQNRVAGVFGSYVDDWENSDKTPIAWPIELMSASNSPTITLVVAENDEDCPLELATELGATF